MCKIRAPTSTAIANYYPLGVGSRVRAALLGQSNFTPLLSPHRVYHALVPRALMLTKPASASLIESKCINAWLGPDRHIVGYPIRGGQLYNLVMVHVGPAAFDRWDQDGNVGEMNKVYEDFDPVIRETLSFVERAKSWKLVESATLESWSSKSGRVVLLGDAAHAMLPYLAQVGTPAATKYTAAIFTVRKLLKLRTGSCTVYRRRQCPRHLSASQRLEQHSKSHQGLRKYPQATRRKGCRRFQSKRRYLAPARRRGATQA